VKRRVGGVVVLASVAMVSVGAASAARSADPVGRRSFTLGRSIDGRPITVIETGDWDNPAKTLVVGCIHGNECAGIAIAQLLARTARLGEADLWIVPDLNPDGAAVSAVTHTAST
jgi:murein tripeptide amidase MpaA